MFISKLVCDKCNTVVDDTDKFCRECGTKGTSDSNKKLDASEFSKLLEKHKVTICKICGGKISEYGGHVCPGLIQKKPSQYYGDDSIRWVDTSYAFKTALL